jgi:nucleoside-diphosphate-sugar epimerase
VVWGDGTQERELIYVDDQVDGILIAAEKANGLINLGTGIKTTIRTLAEEIASAAGYVGKIVYDTTRFVGIKTKVLKIDRARGLLDWNPKTSIRDGIKKTVDWYNSNLLGEELLRLKS